MSAARFYDLFAGIGGFHLGLSMADRSLFRCAGACEIDERAAGIYRRHFGVDPTGDITKIDPASLPDFDVLCAGFPCQPFSHAGRRRGFADARNGNLFEVGIARIAEAKRPAYLLLENVRSLLDNDGGRTFARILLALDGLGYDVGWQCINAKHFVPQSRERVFIVGRSRDEPAGEVLPVAGIGGPPHQEAGGDRREAGHGAPEGGELGVPHQVHAEAGAPARRRHHRGRGGKVLLIQESFGFADITKRFARLADECWTLTTDPRIWVLDGGRARRITPLECERIMGFPDGWTGGIPDVQRYHCLGNAVVPQVVAFVASRLAAQLRRSRG